MTHEQTISSANALKRIGELSIALENERQASHDKTMTIREKDRKIESLQTKIRILESNMNPFDMKFSEHISELIVNILNDRFEEYSKEHEKALEISREQSAKNLNTLMQSIELLNSSTANILLNFANPAPKTISDQEQKEDSEEKINAVTQDSSKKVKQSSQSKTISCRDRFIQHFNELELEKLKRTRVLILRSRQDLLESTKTAYGEFFHENSVWINSSETSNLYSVIKEKLKSRRVDFVIFNKSEVNNITLEQIRADGFDKRAQVICYDQKGMGYFAQEIIKRISKKG